MSEPKSEPPEEAETGEERGGGVHHSGFQQLKRVFLKFESLVSSWWRKNQQPEESHVEERRSSLSQVSTSLSLLPPNKKFINRDILVSGQIPKFFLELRFEKKVRDFNWCKIRGDKVG